MAFALNALNPRPHTIQDRFVQGANLVSTAPKTGLICTRQHSTLYLIGVAGQLAFLPVVELLKSSSNRALYQNLRTKYTTASLYLKFTPMHISIEI